jgi:phosphoenolpyruvate phosphomutase
MKKSHRLRRLLERPQATILCGVHDGLSAGLAERAGFDALWASGFCISASKKLPDVGLVTMTEHLAAAREIDGASSIPVVADVDDGFGDAVIVTRMVREYEAAGIAGVCLEDNRHPKRNSLFSELSRKLVSAEEFAGKVRAAKDTQKDPDFVVIARTEAIVAELGVPEALRRGRMYADAGADLIVVHAKDSTPARVKEFAAQWGGRCPLVCIPTRYPQVTAAEMYEAGYRMIIFANHGLRAAVTAMDRVFRKMASSGSLASVEGEIAALSEIFSLVGFEDVGRIEGRYMAAPSEPGAETPKKT